MSTVLNFGQEDTTFVTIHDMKHMLLSHFRGITRYIKFVYFSDTHPQNQTIRYDPNDTKHLEIHEDGVFRHVPNEYILDTIIMDAWHKLVGCYNHIEVCGKLETFKNSLVSPETFERIEDFVSEYHKLCHGIAPSSLQDIRQDVLEMIRLHSIELAKKAEKKKDKKRSTKN
jgi:hypothetical protein